MRKIKKEQLLWKVLRATTNSPNDVWKESHYVRHEGANKDLLGTKVYRYTVPVKYLGKVAGEQIYLVVQFCTDDLKFPYFVIDKSAFTKDLKASKEYVYAFNVRICLASEFRVKKKGHRLSVAGEIKDDYRKGILEDSIRLIKSKPRYKSINKIKYHKLPSGFTKDSLINLIERRQFDTEELLYKGIIKNNKK